MWNSAKAIVVSKGEKEILERWIRSPSTPQGVALRASIISLAANGISNNGISIKLSISRPTVLLWRKRFKEEGTKGLSEIKDGRGRKPEIPLAKLERIVHDTLNTKPEGGTHWSCRSMAAKHGVSHFVIQKVWGANGLKPHLVKTFKLSNDKQFIEKLRDVVGLYMNPPEHALVFSVDEKSQIQALDRTQQSFPMTKGYAATMTHDYKRNGTTTLFAALNILKGEVIGQCMSRHRHQEFLKFIRMIDEQTPQELDIHCIVDNYGTHKHPRVQNWLKKHPRFHFHFIPTSSSWLNLVERWFGEITRKRIRRGVFHNVPELIKAIDSYIEYNNKNPKPFVWSKSADEIIRKVNHCKAILKSAH